MLIHTFRCLMRRRPSISQADKVGYRWQCAPRLLHGGRWRWSRVIVRSCPVSGVVTRHGGGHALCGMDASTMSERGWELIQAATATRRCRSEAQICPAILPFCIRMMPCLAMWRCGSEVVRPDGQWDSNGYQAFGRLGAEPSLSN
jgi:hypothetical protein